MINTKTKEEYFYIKSIQHYIPDKNGNHILVTKEIAIKYLEDKSKKALASTRALKKSN